MRRFVIYIHLISLIATGIATAEISITAKIEEDLNTGKISYETSLLYKAYSIFEPSRLPLEYQELVEVRKCGTPTIIELRSNWEKLSKPVQSLLSSYMARPTPGEQYISPSGKFRIHYDSSGRDAVDPLDQDGNGVPDYIDKAVAIFDSCFVLEVDSLGYMEPLSDSTYDDGGPEYDVYVRDLAGRRVYGYTNPERKAGPGFGYTSFIEVDNDYKDAVYKTTRGIDALRVTAAHEFFHAIQFSYYGGDDARWWMEICSTWMEDVAYDQVNDYYSYLRFFFNYPGTSLDVLNNEHEYGASIFAHYLAKRFGKDVIRSIWERIGQVGKADISIFDDVIPGGMAEAIREFSLWNYYTGLRADPIRCYPEGEFYPEISVQAFHDAYPASGSGWVDHLGSNYIRFIPQKLTGGLRIKPRGHKGDWSFQASCFPPRNELPGGTDIPDWSKYQEIVLILTATSFTGRSFGYSYLADFDPDLTGGPVTKIAVLKQNSPNPFVIEDSDRTMIPFDLANPAHVTISIYSVSGQLVRTEDLGFLGQGSYEWDGRNQDGKPVASGLYFYRIRARTGLGTGDFTATKKLILVR